MEIELNKRVVTSILKHIPKNYKQVNYLVNTLKISRESAYRRIRGAIPFTVEELVTLAINLDFSIDTIYDNEKHNHSFHDLSQIQNNTDDFFVLMLKKFNELIENMRVAKKREAIMAFNTFPPLLYINYPALFKFMYYKWLNQNNDSCQSRLFSETVLPEEAILFQKKMKGNIIPCEKVVIILDVNVFLNLIKEIQYYYNRKLLTNDEIILLREDILRLIEEFERIVQSGTYESANIQIYLSSLCINFNSIYYSYDENVEPLFWIFTINPVIIKNAKIISMQLKWINMLKRQSALITQSNEIMQAEFFFRQREYINKYLTLSS